MTGAYWDHIAQGTLSGVRAVNTEFGVCALPQQGGIYLLRFFVNSGTMGGSRRIEASVDGWPGAGNTILRSGFIADINGGRAQAFENEIVVGPTAVASARAFYTLRTAMIAGDELAFSTWARFMGTVDPRASL